MSIIIQGASVIYGKVNSGLFIKSKNNLSAGGLTIGASITKDMSSATRPTTPTIFPGTAAPSAGVSSFWSDWGGDIFDSWGYFYLYDSNSNTYLNVVFTTINQADGTISSQDFSLGGRTFTIRHGWTVQGIYKMDISINDDLDFSFGGNGNMGSDTSTNNFNLTQSYNLNSENFTLYYNQNYQTGTSTELFYMYIIPYEKDKNKNTITYSKVISGNDFLHFYITACKRGATLYFSKTNDVKNWVINDLQLTN